jgi:hypothetical protein
MNEQRRSAIDAGALVLIVGVARVAREQAFSPDGGQTREANRVMEFTRVEN